MSSQKIRKGNYSSSVSTYSRPRRAPNGFVLKSCLIAFIFLLDSCTASLPCSCSPSTYKWTLDLNSSCPDVIPENDGIGQNSFCKILTASTSPVLNVTSFEFYEYGASVSELVNYRLIKGEWYDGDEMSVDSITKDKRDIYTSGVGFELKGYTEDGKTTTFQWVVQYTNACGEDPYENISSVGWLEIAGQTPASSDTCTPCKSSKSSKSWEYPKTGKGSKSFKSPKSSKSSRSAKCEKTVLKVKKSKRSKSERSSSSNGRYRI